MKCETDGCDNAANFHVTDKKGVELVTLHFCYVCARNYLAPLKQQQVVFPPRRKIDSASYCSLCGHDDSSHVPLDGNSEQIPCPRCSRSIPDITNVKHPVIPGTDLNDVVMRECRIIPVMENDGLLTVVHDFVDVEQIDKVRFIMNTDFILVYAEPQHIDSILQGFGR